MSQHLTDAQLDQIEQAARPLTGSFELTYSEGGVRDEDGFEVYLSRLDPATTLQLAAEIKEQRAQIAAVRELHQAMRAYWGGEVETVCSACFSWLGDYIPHPCPTIRALDGES